MQKIKRFFVFMEGVSKGRHSALDAESHGKAILIIRGLRVKPARTKRIFRLLTHPHEGVFDF